MYRSVDVNYYDKKIVADIAVKIDFTSVKKLYKKSRGQLYKSLINFNYS